MPAVAHGKPTGGRVSHHHWHKKWRDTTFALLVTIDDLILECGQATDTGTEKHSTSRWVRIDLASLLQGLMGRRERKLGIAIGTPALLGVIEEGSGVKVIDPTLDILYRALKARPKGIFAHAAVREHSNTGDGNATKVH